MANQADELWGAFQNDPVATYRAIGQQLGSAGYPVGDPRIDEMYGFMKEQQRQRDLEAYDAAVNAITSDPANADIEPDRLHTFVAAAEGNFERALSMYRQNELAAVQRHSADLLAAGFSERQESRDYSPRDSLHKAIEEATEMSRRRS